MIQPLLWMGRLVELERGEDTMSNKNRAYFEMTYDALANALSLPENTVILRVISDLSITRDIEKFHIIVASPDLPELQEGDATPLVTPGVYKRDDGTNVWKWTGWGIE